LTSAGSALYAGLRSAVAAEAVAVQELGYYAQIAEIEGHPEVAGLLNELSESTMCAAHGHLEAIEALEKTSEGEYSGRTRLNLAAAVTSGLEGIGALYPDLADTARRDGLCDVASWLDAVMALKRAHLARLDRALESVSAPAEEEGGAPSGSQPVEGGRS
jgi:rubrerythrin